MVQCRVAARIRWKISASPTVMGSPIESEGRARLLETVMFFGLASVPIGLVIAYVVWDHHRSATVTR